MNDNSRRKKEGKMPPRISGGSGAPLAHKFPLPQEPVKTNLEKILTGERSVQDLIKSTDLQEAFKARSRNYLRRGDELDPVLAFHLGRKYQ